MVAAYVINPNDQVKRIDLGNDWFDQIKNEVAGYLQYVTWNDMTWWMDEDGIARRLPGNHLATAVLSAAGGMHLASSAAIRGTVVVAGNLGEDLEEVPWNWSAIFRNMAKVMNKSKLRVPEIGDWVYAPVGVFKSAFPRPVDLNFEVLKILDVDPIMCSLYGQWRTEEQCIRYYHQMLRDKRDEQVRTPALWSAMEDKDAETGFTMKLAEG